MSQPLNDFNIKKFLEEGLVNWKMAMAWTLAKTVGRENWDQ